MSLGFFFTAAYISIGIAVLSAPPLKPAPLGVAGPCGPGCHGLGIGEREKKRESVAGPCAAPVRRILMAVSFS